MKWTCKSPHRLLMLSAHWLIFHSAICSSGFGHKLSSLSLTSSHNTGTVIEFGGSVRNCFPLERPLSMSMQAPSPMDTMILAFRSILMLWTVFASSWEDAFRFVDHEFKAAADEAYSEIGSPVLMLDQGWAIFTSMWSFTCNVRFYCRHYVGLE